MVAEGLAGTLALVQALGDAGAGARLWVLTRGAVAAGAGEVPVSPAGAQVWGLGRVAALEHPDRWGGLVDLPAEFGERAGRRLCEVLAGGSGEDQVAIRGPGCWPGGWSGPRSARPGPARVAGAPWRARGTVLVTGGTGALGGHAGPLAGRARVRGHLVLATRRGPAAPGAAALAAELAGGRDGGDGDGVRRREPGRSWPRCWAASRPGR